MVDFEKLAKEFIFLREKIKEVANLLTTDNFKEAAFLLGCLHNICHFHAVSIGQLVPPKFEPVKDQAPAPEAPKEGPKDEQPHV